MSGIDKWPVERLTDNSKIRERNLEKLLNKKYFYEVSEEVWSLKEFSIPVYRFPVMYYCPECHALDYYWNIKKSENNNSDYNSDLYCNQCFAKHGRKIKLVPSRFVVSCANGHIDEFPYSWWVHKGKGICSNPKLYLEYSGSTGGLDSIIIRCGTCGARRSMDGCMQKEALKGLHCRGTMPWLGFKEQGKGWYVDNLECHAKIRVMQRSANNIYYPVSQSALTIPPWSSRIHKIFESHNELMEAIFENYEDRDIFEKLLKKHFDKYKFQYECSFDNFRNEALRAYGKSEDSSNNLTPDEIIEDEYHALCSEDINDEMFKTISSQVSCSLKEYIDIIKCVTRLREVNVLKGFNRIYASRDAEGISDSESELDGREYTPIFKEETDWLPAVELWGEGIFIRLREDKVEEWEKKNIHRYDGLILQAQKYKWIGRNKFGKNNIRYILLHTLAHLLIRQLTIQCGYTSAAIKEKIYSTINNSKEKMSGILIYTSATDTDGSLGGLTREGECDRIRNTFMDMLKSASWCSNDPICIESRSQGYHSLNIAACHACALLPETSCENFNSLLDRGAIVGTPDNPQTGYFSKLLKS